jgi:Domain of unknown function (DUF4412)
MLQFKSFTRSPWAVPFLALLLITPFGAAYSVAKQDSASDSAQAKPAPSSSSPGGGAFEGVVTAKEFTPDRTLELRCAIKGARARIETHLSQGGEQTSVELRDMSSGAATFLTPWDKAYFIGRWRPVASGMTENTERDTATDLPKVTSTGETETIAGVTCEHWLFTDKRYNLYNVDMCLAQGMGYFDFGSQFSEVLDVFKNLAAREKARGRLNVIPEFAKFIEGGAFPLKVAPINNGRPETFIEVTGIEQKPLDDSLFTVPAGYKKIEFRPFAHQHQGKDIQ